MNKVAIFASGSGTNAENIIRYFQGHAQVSVELVLSNKKDAYVLQRASGLKVDTQVFSRNEFTNSTGILSVLQEREVDYLVLAGFLWLVPKYLIDAYPNAIINIHPALLPKYGGKGMYGSYVHQAVVEAKEKETGITIHYCNEVYDDGAVIFQASCEVNETDTPEMVAQKVHDLEYEHFPRIIEKEILKG